MRILIVDDEELAQKRLFRLLGELDFKDIKMANNPYEAFELIKNSHFDLIFLDINMPQMNGLELGRKIKRLFSDRAIIYQSAYGEHALDAFDVGAIGYLVKPYSLEQLKQSISRVQTKEQEYLAKEKMQNGIINDLHPDDCTVFYKAADILSGDFYSIYRLKNDTIFICLIDAQGHGISPALTVFAVSSVLNKFVYDVTSLEELISKASFMLQTFLAEEEQLSYTLALINDEDKTLSYASGGMYPFLIKKGETIERIKANNTPFMNFSQPPKVDILDIDNWDGMIFYSDAIMEHQKNSIKSLTPHAMLQNQDDMTLNFEILKNHNFEDDVTIVHIKRSRTPIYV